MIARTFALGIGVVAAGIALLCPFTRADPPKPAAVSSFAAGEYTLTGPFTHENLTVFLIHGPDRLKGKHYLTLQQALQDKIVVVHETGAVNDLQIENVSAEVDVYIQSGDIIKGGQQDRTIAMDFIVPPKSGLLSLNVFCVENGRWAARGNENAANFASSSLQVAGKNMKIAVQKDASQSEVWRSVRQNQDKLSQNAGQSVADARSATSFQLTLENAKVKEVSEAYAGKLASILEGSADAIGYATAINGKMSSADVFASHELFTRLWPRLLNSAAVEAFAELHKDSQFAPVKTDAVKAVIEDADKAQASSRDVTARVQLVTRESKDNILFETHDRAASALATDWVHRCYLTKEGYVPAPAPARSHPQSITTNANGDIVNGPGSSTHRQIQQPPQSQPPAQPQQQR